MWAKIISPGTIFKPAGKVDLIRKIGRLQPLRLLHLCTVRNVGTDFGRTPVSTNKLDKNGFGENETGKERPSFPQIWLIFPGLGSQSNEIPKELKNIEPFSESLNDSRKTLKQIGIDIDELLHPDNPSIHKCVRSALISQTVLQMALYETIKHVLPSDPSGMIGISAGDNLSAYADGCFSAEEVILVIDSIARAFLATKRFSGGMAMIRLPWKDVQTMCPPDIYLAGENSKSNIVVSGPSESVKSFVKKLEMNGVFVRMLESCEIAPHSPYMEETCELLRGYLKEIIPNKRLRSSKWLSTGALEEDWDSPEVQYVSARYVMNTVINQIYFHQALLHIPKNSVVLEISPKATLGVFVKETVPSAKYLPCILKKDKVNPAILSKQNFQYLFNQ